MDEKALNELLECSVCLDRLDASSKVLPCQHTFCRWCLEEIVSTKKELRCPECRCLVETKIQDLPTNILLIRLLEGMKNAARSSGSSNKSSPSRASDKTASGPTSPVHSIAEGGILSEQHKVVDLSNQPCAKALYNYDATEPGDLSFKKGDIILLRKQVDENWYHGELHGQQGFFPASYVQIVNPMSNKEIPSCKALYDFTDQNEKDCLTFQKDETMTVIRRIDDNWIEGKLGDNIGIFPKSFVEFNDAAKLLINFQASLVKASHSQMNDLNNQTRTHHVPSYANLSASANPSTSQPSISSSSSTPSTSVTCPQLGPRLHSSPTNTITTVTMPHVTTGNLSVCNKSSHKRHSLTTLSPAWTSSSPLPNRLSVEVPVTSGADPWSASAAASASTDASVVNPTTKNASQDVSAGHTSPVSPVSLFVALYAYKPEKDDEIELQKGELYSVTEKCQDGWYKGVCLSSGVSGVFPGNYVQPVKMTSTKPNTTKNASCMSASPTSTQVSTTDAASPLHLASLSTSRHHQISVTRTHSFPKTSLLANLDSHVRMRSQGAASQRLALSHSRPITNITQAQIRSTQTTLGMSAAQSLAQSIMLPTSPVMSTGYFNSHLQAVAAADENKSQSLPCGIRAHQAYHNTQVALKETTSGSKSSPKTSRRHTLSERTNKHLAASDDCQSSHHINSCDQLQCVMSANANITPPNVVIGATGGCCQQVVATNKEKEKKRDKERLPISLMKKISAGLPMRVRKSKSPIPDSSKDVGSSSSCHQPSSNADILPSTSSPSSSALTKPSVSSSVHSHNHAHHHRSGSAPGYSPSRSANSGTTSHKKSSSVDAARQNSGKPGKVKPLLRERYQCIVPYPPQSDIELELKLGDIVYVYNKSKDGWYKGMLESSGKLGLFPGSFVERA